MTIKEIYKMLRGLELTDSQLQFSRQWLGRSPRYYSYLIATQREPGLATLNGIWWRLNSLKSAEAARAQQVDELRQAIAAHISRRAITDRQKRRK